MVWGAILYGHKLPRYLCRLAPARTINWMKVAKETVTSKVYLEQILAGPLQDYIYEACAQGTPVTVVKDGAPVHFKGFARKLRLLCPIPTHFHPPSSPDLNPIEGCWRIVKEKIKRLHPDPTSKEGLWTAVQEAWDSIDQAVVDGMIMDMVRRRPDILAVQGALASHVILVSTEQETLQLQHTVLRSTLPAVQLEQ